MSPAASPAPLRFHQKYEVSSTGCWIWTASKTKGYGYLRVDGHNLRAHRYAYELLVGPIPTGLQLDHLCRVRACVNPAHLEPVTSGENTRRSPIHNSQWRDRTHCKNGHEFDQANTRLRGGTRYCRACSRESMRRIRARRAAS